MDVAHDIELLRIQAEQSLDDRGRIAGVDGVAIACAGSGQIAWIGGDVPDELAARLQAVLDRADASQWDAAPAVLEDCRRLLGASGRSPRSEASLVFVIPDDTPLTPGPLHIARSDGDHDHGSTGALLRGGNPGNWHPLEWDELLDGRLGPWAIALEEDLVISICHTARRLTASAAECGVWTLPGFRGRGYAAATTAAWAAIVRPSGRHLFYSCDADDLSSQGVARRLDLRLVGRTWSLAVTRETGDDERLHPLSSLRRGS